MSNTTIAIPPFPSQDLAKLVLGYLAEEQLMTAYDEFLQASPYLDALRNEYDRIFMTSLKNILAEYRAVKIFVETCKPFILRRKLFQCSNLLEIVKFLVYNVDINKIQLQEGVVDKVGSSRHSLSKTNTCDVCVSLKLPSCTCKTSHSTSQIEATSLEKSVETTSLADLPGNTSSYKKKITKEVDFKNTLTHSITSSDQITDGRSAKHAKYSDNLSSTTVGSDTDNVISSVTENKCPPNPSLLVKENYLESRQNVQGSNGVFSLVSDNRSDNLCKPNTFNDTASCIKTVATESVQNCTTGDSSSINKLTVPDSSTSENIILQTPTTEQDNVTNSTNASKNIGRPLPLLIKIGNEHKHMNLQPNSLHSLPKLTSKESLIKSTNKKIEDQISPKITILSDVKVDKDLKMPAILKNASTSLVPMQTLFINGTPAYKNTQTVDQTFTKDEIMAMPTIILVPASDKNKKIVPSVTQNNALNTSSSGGSCLTSQTLEPLVIDVSSNDNASTQINSTMFNNPEKQTTDNMLVKTVDVMSVSHASLPKDDNAGLKASTPHVLPPTRKSSSTPRRTSHVRVLDFTTPRRILHETLNEQQGELCKPSDDTHAQSTSMPVTNNTEDTVNNGNNLGNVNTGVDCKGAIKENKASIKLYNWDAQLRALAYVGNGNIENTDATRKSKPKKSKKKVSPTNKNTSNKHNKSNDAKTQKSNDKKKEKKATPKIKTTKIRKKSIEANINVDEISTVTVSVIKPNINIISRKKGAEPMETEKPLNKSCNNEVNIDTPELEKMSLHNEIGVKLNLSDFLETPYKQALYDIQMETPKFLGPDIPGDPLSDVKIMNIPTPRFLNTPKLPQNTPSSYSSRPTDYSSGGSYYKPDDQDYVLGNDIDDMSMSIPLSKINKESKTIPIEKTNVQKECEVKSRPVRQCTKNVSYNYGTPTSSKIKDTEDKIERSSTCSETSINKSEKKIDKSKTSKSDKDSIVGKQREPKKKVKKYKSPLKKEAPKTFMKIKPRRTTPVKEVLGKGRKKNSDLSHNMYMKSHSKKIMAGKEKTVCFSPMTVASVPTKSRRKSSTPRKLHCTKRFNSESSDINSPERKKLTSESLQSTNVNAFCVPDSDSEQPPLRWSDDGSQESKIKTNEEKLNLANESDDISRIKEYIKTHHLLRSPNEISPPSNEVEGTLQVDLIKRGFDIETARMIERDLLETPTRNLSNQKPVQNILQSIPSPISQENDSESKSKKSDKSIESDCSTSNNLQIVQDEDDNDEIDFSVHDCNEDTNNYFAYSYDEVEFVPSHQVKLKETFSMEICIENDVTIRLRATPFNSGFEHESKLEDPDDCNKKTIEKPTSPSHYSSLYTPRKAQCYEIFDSTLASLDTPLKSNSPKAEEIESVTEIVLEVEKLETDIKQKAEGKKRKRFQSGTSDETTNVNKKVKPDTSYLLNSAGIQNIDIESVLSKLHGP